MATMTFLVLVTIRKRRLSDSPRSKRCVKVVSALLATTVVARAAVKLCNMCAGVSSSVVAVAVRARAIHLVDTILEDPMRKISPIVTTHH